MELPPTTPVGVPRHSPRGGLAWRRLPSDAWADSGASKPFPVSPQGAEVASPTGRRTAITGWRGVGKSSRLPEVARSQRLGFDGGVVSRPVGSSEQFRGAKAGRANTSLRQGTVAVVRQRGARRPQVGLRSLAHGDIGNRATPRWMGVGKSFGLISSGLHASVQFGSWQRT
jgi:hypothetical protein